MADPRSDGIRLQPQEFLQSEARKSSMRETPKTSFGDQFKAGIIGTSNVVGRAAASAGYAIPGANIVSAAITGAGSVQDASTGLSSGSALGGSSSALGGFGTGGSTVDASTSGGLGGVLGGGGSVAAGGNDSSSAGQLMQATKQMQEMNQQFNLQYLQLQEGMQSDSRQYTAVSNVIKTKSDTAKNTLSNLK